MLLTLLRRWFLARLGLALAVVEFAAAVLEYLDVSPMKRSALPEWSSHKRTICPAMRA
jgi:hypothetical protein